MAMTAWHYLIHKHLSYKLGFTLYKNQFGPGLYIMHYGTIVVNPKCRIGDNCNINAGVNIGMGGSSYSDKKQFTFEDMKKRNVQNLSFVMPLHKTNPADFLDIYLPTTLLCKPR